MKQLPWLSTVALLCWACATRPVQLGAEGAVTGPQEVVDVADPAGSFGDDLRFLRQHTPILLLADPHSLARVALAPEYQGRVMTSTVGGRAGPSFGWINREVIKKGTRQPHMTVLGGEDRFWLGPEGGQYALYFPPKAAFEFEHWQVPEALDWGGWETVRQENTEATFRKRMTLQNYSGTQLKLQVDRTVRLLPRQELETHLGMALGELQAVGYQSDNRVTNTGQAAWTKEGGLVSVWILGLYNPSPNTTVVIPFRGGGDALGPVVNDAYFGKVPADRLIQAKGVLYFRGDGQRRGKIGIPRPRAQPTLGSYDADNRVLTLVQYTLPTDAQDYVNSMWELQERPYRGDVVNSYNDGPPAPDQAPLGPFYELETSSPALALAPGASANHVHRTLHLQGPAAALDAVARAQLGVSLAEIQQAFASP